MKPTNDLFLNGEFDRDQILSIWDITNDGFWLIFIKMDKTI